MRSKAGESGFNVGKARFGHEIVVSDIGRSGSPVVSFSISDERAAYRGKMGCTFSLRGRKRMSSLSNWMRVGVFGKPAYSRVGSFAPMPTAGAPRVLAIGRLKEAAAEIRSVAKSDAVAAGDGVVSLMERIWPSFQGIDTSSGALGAAVLRTVNEPIPILTVAPADRATRGKWLERLF